VEICGYPRKNYNHLDLGYLRGLGDALREYSVEAVSAYCSDLLRYPPGRLVERSVAIAETEHVARAAYALGVWLLVVLASYMVNFCNR